MLFLFLDKLSLAWREWRKRDQILMLMWFEENHFLKAIGIFSCILFVYLTKAFHFSAVDKSWSCYQMSKFKTISWHETRVGKNYFCRIFSALGRKYSQITKREENCWDFSENYVTFFNLCLLFHNSSTHKNCDITNERSHEKIFKFLLEKLYFFLWNFLYLNK